jgi:hypothetical protein
MNNPIPKTYWECPICGAVDSSKAIIEYHIARTPVVSKEYNLGDFVKVKLNHISQMVKITTIKYDVDHCPLYYGKDSQIPLNENLM